MLVVFSSIRNIRKVMALPIKHVLCTPQSIAFLKPSPLGSTYFLPTAAKSKHKFIWNEFEHLKDGA
ncbi:hypothetical protein [Paraglaciecola sp. MB-3u-78]|jgi:competence transcription factor ComK|uniref:hypothetical protein n=1 Tax=Paraglaciecola sp. MB-3u-78 TaxID=2058332 RepID=UPI000C33C737|nr:hypothetical protein [Paraglaciecola sp. MB-3u-78]PKG92891.1 hypothetical protein CXF95_28330 [Paraglaciecola sp. MB-3u-78]